MASARVVVLEYGLRHGQFEGPALEAFLSQQEGEVAHLKQESLDLGGNHIRQR